MTFTEIFKNRPFSLFCAVFMLAALVGFFVIGEVKLIFAVIFGVAIIISVIISLIGRKFFKACRAILLLSLAFAIGIMSSYIYFDMRYSRLRKYDGLECVVDATVIETSYYSEYGSAYTVRLNSINGRQTRELAYLSCEYGGSFIPGDRFLVSATIGEPEDDSPAYSQKTNMISNGICAVISSEKETDCYVFARDQLTPEIAVKRMNAELSVRLSRIVGGEAGDLASAMLLADRSGLSDKTRLDFSRVGTSHLLALSGLHMAIVSAIAEFLLRKLCIKKTLRCLILALILISYLTLVGFALSAVRAVIMIAVVYLAYILRTPHDPRTSLFFAGFFILLVFPFAVCDIGFWMSFFATFGIIIVSPCIGKLWQPKRRDGTLKIIVLRAVKYIISALIITLTANLSVLIFSCLFFGQVSLISPVSNLILAPLATPIIFFAAMTMIFYFIHPPAAELCANITSALGDIMLDISAHLSDMRGIVLSLEYDFAGPIICIFAISTLILLIIRLRRRSFVLLPAAVCALAFCICLGAYNLRAADQSEISYIRDQDSEMLIISECGSTVICDISDGYYSRFALAGIISRGHCATELDALLLTHYHSRQASGVKRFLDNYKTRTLLLPEPQNDYEYRELTELLTVAGDRGVKAVIYRRGTDITLFGETSLRVSPYRKLSRSVEAQVGITVERGDDSLLYLGSSFFECDENESFPYTPSADSIILGCHGPKPKEPLALSLPSDTTVILSDTEAVDAELIKFYGDTPPHLIYCPEYSHFILD